MTTQIQRMKSFLELFGGKLSKKRFAISTSNSTAQAMRTSTNLEDALRSNGCYDIYFYVNNGGTKAGAIDELTACFVDLDAGRDKAGKYLKPSAVEKKKAKMLVGIKKFSKEVANANVVVETRNGFQVYWLLTKMRDINKDIKVWNLTQAKINNWFQDYGGDHRAMKVNQIMRLPGTYWCKRWEGKGETYMTSYMKMSPTRHNLFSLLKKLGETPSVINRPNTTTWEGSAEKFKVTRGYDRDGFRHTQMQRLDNAQEQVALPDSRDSQSLRSFLRDVAQVLYQKQMYYMSKVAWAFYNNFED